jgi:hypothetical protein
LARTADNQGLAVRIVPPAPQILYQRPVKKRACHKVNPFCSL